jgi:hypothetical protein
MEVFIIMILWFIFTKMFAEVGALLLIGLWAAIRFLYMAQWMAVFAILRAALWLLVQLARGARLAVIFLYFLASEALRGDDPAEEARAEEDGGAAGDPDSNDDADLYQAALMLLGLPPKFTRAELDAAFKAAIKKAHPDAGGSVDQAQAVNMARDLLLPHAI